MVFSEIFETKVVYDFENNYNKRQY